MKLFVKTITCSSGVHCRTCRDREGGRAWRLSLLEHGYELPAAAVGDEAVDFECPKGVAWGVVTCVDEAMVRVKSRMEAREAVCRSCSSFREIAADKVKCGRAIELHAGIGCGCVSLATGRCPEGLWTE